jgi:hypothetical protein
VRQVGTEQDEVTGVVVSDSVTNQALPTAIDDQREFEFRMVVPVKTKLKFVPLEYDERKW